MSRKPTKFVFVTGGVVSSIGKGLADRRIASRNTVGPFGRNRAERLRHDTAQFGVAQPGEAVQAPPGKPRTKRFGRCDHVTATV